MNEKERLEFLFKERYEDDLELVKNINNRITPYLIKISDLSFIDEYYNGIFYRFTKKEKKYNFEIEPLSNEDKKMFAKYINEYKDTAKGREFIIYFNMLKLAIDTVLIYYNTDGTKKSVDEVIKYIISD
mgnify:CR=1 FL=1